MCSCPLLFEISSQDTHPSPAPTVGLLPVPYSSTVSRVLPFASPWLYIFPSSRCLFTPPLWPLSSHHGCCGGFLPSSPEFFAGRWWVTFVYMLCVFDWDVGVQLHGKKSLSAFKMDLVLWIAFYLFSTKLKDVSYSRKSIQASLVKSSERCKKIK